MQLRGWFAALDAVTI